VLGSEQDGVVFDLDALRSLAGAVDNSRHDAGMTQAAARTFPLVITGRSLDFMSRSHVGITYLKVSCLAAVKRLPRDQRSRKTGMRDE
jgi:hypothetical protein